MKKFLCVMLSVLLVFGMTACQSEGTNKPADSTAATTQENQNSESASTPTVDTQGSETTATPTVETQIPETTTAPTGDDQNPESTATPEETVTPVGSEVTEAPPEAEVTTVPGVVDVTSVPGVPEVTKPVGATPTVAATPTEEAAKPHTSHSYGDWKVTASATCTKTGSKERACTVCGKTETQSIKATGHSYGNWKVTKAATCTASGTQERTCKTCGVAQTETVTASHKWSSWKTTQTESYYWIDEYNDVVGKKPAIRSRSCSLCGATKSEEYVVSDDEKDALALAVAKKIVAQVDSKTYATDLERVQAAASIVSSYSQSCIYHLQDTKPKDYKTAYGVFVAGIYTCAGSARAMGLVLDCMGYKWEHANQNGYTHQWCILTMDGKVGYADGQVGWVDYGEHPAASW